MTGSRTLVLVLLAALGRPGFAADLLWLGASDGLFADPFRWDESGDLGIPDADDVAVFDVAASFVVDLDGSGDVALDDLITCLSSWGACAPGASCPADLTGDGIVGFADLSMLLGAWGPCP